MKLKIKETTHKTKPKQTEGKLIAKDNSFRVKPKPLGVNIYKNTISSVLKNDRRVGVRIEKQKITTILKQQD